MVGALFDLIGKSPNFRGDTGFALPEMIRMCERDQVGYVIGFASNAVLKRKIEAWFEQTRIVCWLTGDKARLFDDVYYQYQAGR